MLGVVVIDYKSPQMTIDYINKELPKVDVPYVCIVVVNEATDKEVSIIADATHGIVVEDGKNARDGKVFIIPPLTSTRVSILKAMIVFSFLVLCLSFLPRLMLECFSQHWLPAILLHFNLTGRLQLWHWPLFI